MTLVKTLIVALFLLGTASTTSADIEIDKDLVTTEISTELAKEIRCLELNLHYEARGEPIEGIKAVANVTLNRVKSGKFPDTVCKVVRQPYQFSWVTPKMDFSKFVKISDHIRQIAYEALTSEHWKDNTKGAMFFHNTTVENFNRRRVAVIGNHLFYR